MLSVQSIERAFAILEVVAASPSDGVGVTEIANQVSLPKSTVSRLLSTLENVAAVERVPANDRFQIGATIMSLASQVPYSRHLITIVHPYLLELAAATGETINLCLPHGDQVHYIDQVDSQYHLQIQDWTGYRFPMHVTSTGKLFMAYWSETSLKQYLSRPLAAYTSKTIIEPTLFRQELNKIRAQGYAWAVGEAEEEIVGLAAPIRDESEQVVASICVGGPAFRFPAADEADKIIAIIVDIGRRISEHVGKHL